MNEALTQTQPTTGDLTAIRPFRVSFSAEDVADLRRRVRATKWPERETVNDTSQGVPLATVQKLARYWETDYDWRKCEAKLNALPQFITTIDGVDIHFIHVRSKHPNALPIIVTHGWPGSIIEQLKIIDPLTNPTATWRERGGRLRCRDSVAAGLRVLRQAHGDRLGSHPHRTRVGRADEAPRIQAVRGAGRRLGQRGHGADVSAGSSGVDRHSHQHACHRAARHRQGGLRRCAGACGSLGRREARVRAARLLLQARPGLRQRDGEPPADALRASRIRRSAWPPGCSTTTRAAWRSSSRVFDGQPEGLTRDDVLDNVTLYWLTNTAISSARLYWESHLAFFAPKNVPIPAAVSAFRGGALSGPARAGRRRRIPSSSITTSSTRAGTSRRGSSRSSWWRTFARRSSLCVSGVDLSEKGFLQ